MRFTTIAWKNLRRRPTRTVLTIVGLSVAVAAVVALVGIADGFERSYIDLFKKRGVELIVQRANPGNDNLDRMLDPSIKAKLEKLHGAREVFPGLMDVVALEEYGLPAVFVVGWEPGSRLMNRLTITAGRTLRPGDRSKAIIGSVLAANVSKKPGDKLTLHSEPVEIVGIYDGHDVFENGGLFMPLVDLQRLMDTKQVTAFSISVEHPDDPDEVPAVQRRIQTMDPHLLATPVADFVQNIQQIRMARGVAWAVSAIALVIGAIGMLNTMVMSVAERIREIGTLRAIGWTKRRVMRVIFFESVLLSVGGAALGTLAAMGLTKYLSNFRLTSGYIEGEIAPAVLLQGLLVAILVGVGGAAYPAFWGASQPPIEALRRK
jgi:putative ABC transport system permease protein